VALAFRARYGVDVSAKSSCLEKAKLWILGVHVRGRTTAAQSCGFLRRTGAWCVLVGTRSTRCKARSLRVAVGSNTCKTTGMARRPALKRRRVCAAARCGQQANTRAHKARPATSPRPVPQQEGASTIPLLTAG
jgi:hypothetical protein